MPIIFIRQFQAWNKPLIPINQAIARALIHKVARPFQRSTFPIGFVSQQGFDPFGMNILCPFGAE